MWVILAIFSAFLLGIYDIFKKLSLQDNAVLPVLFFSTLTSAIVFSPLVIISHFHPEYSNHNWYIKPQTITGHLFFLLKSAIVGTSWIFAYFAVKNLPLTIAAPIRASAPLWTLLGALLIYGERMNLLQWVGVVLTITFYYGFSFTGKKEGISFRKNKWVLFMTIATLVSSASGLFDKYLLAHFDRLAVQGWSYIYMVPINLFIITFFWLPKREQYAPFKWRNTIILIGLTLAIADFVYFKALSLPGALIAVISTVRRSSSIVSFIFAAILFKEQNIKIKGLLLLGILLGIILIALGSNPNTYSSIVNFFAAIFSK